MSFHFSSRATLPADTGARLEAARTHEQAARDKLAELGRKYSDAVSRSAADTALVSESMETKRAHAAVVAQRDTVERAADQTAECARQHQAAIAREERDRQAAVWDRVDQISAERVAEAENIADLAGKLANARTRFNALAGELRSTIPNGAVPHGHGNLFVEADQHFLVELERAGASGDPRLANLRRNVQPLDEMYRGFRKFVAQLRSNAMGREDDEQVAA